MTTIELAEIDYLRSTAQKLKEAGHGQKGAVVANACQFLCISKAELYRRLEEKVGFKSERKTRADKGKSLVTPEQALLIGGMMQSANSATGKERLKLPTTMEILVADGKIPDVSTTTISRALRKYHCHPEQLRTPSAHIQQRSLHPNHAWQIDASICVLFYLNKGGLQVMEEKEFNKNKPANLKKIEKERVIRYVISDHYSGSLYLEYVFGSEDSNNLTQVFLNAIQHRSQHDPLHGVPFILMMDKGSANLSGLFLNLLDRLHIKYIAHTAGNPRAKGQVECAQNIVECKFETRLRFMNVQSLEELNQEMNKTRLSFNEKNIHGRTQKSRNAVWMTIRPEHLRIAPSAELCRELVTTKPAIVTVKGGLNFTYTVKGFGNQSYDVRHVPNVYVKSKLEVIVNPYRAPDVDIVTTDSQGKPLIITVSPMPKDAAGFFENANEIGQEIKSLPDSVVDIARKNILKQAYNATTEAEVNAAIKRRQVPYEGQINPMADVQQNFIPDYLPRAGEQLITEQTSRQLAPLNHVEAAKQIRALLVSHGLGHVWTGDTYRHLVNAHPENVPVEAVRHIADSLIEHHQTKTPTPNLRVVGQ